MIRVHTEIGGWYGDNTIEGDCVSLHKNSHIILNGTRVELPTSIYGKENILQLVAIRWQGQVLIAGQGQVGDKGSGNWLYIDGAWKNFPESFGTFACAFGTDSLYLVSGNNFYRVYDLISGTLSPNLIPRQIGSQGIRYIDFRQSYDGIVTGDATYGPNPYELSQWTLRDDLVFGQSYIDGCISWLLGEVDLSGKVIKRKIEPGDCQFIRLHRFGNNICVSIVKQVELTTVFYWMTVEDLKLFPPIVDIIPPDPVPIPPLPDPIPEPIPPSPQPQPEPVFKPIKELKLMDPEVVSIIGPGDKFLRIVNGKPIFDADVESIDTDFTISKPDDRFAIMQEGLYLGADALNPPSANVGDQLYMIEQRQEYESWFIGTTPKGRIVAFVEYLFKPLVSTSITIKRKS